LPGVESSCPVNIMSVMKDTKGNFLSGTFGCG
jgi:hypothetical protein